MTKASEKQTAKDNIEAADGITPKAELEAALDEPAGSTEFSGASAGIKAEATDDPGTFDKPRATVKAEAAAQKRIEEVRKIQLDAHERNVTNVPSYATETVYANRPEKGTPASITIAQTGSGLVLTATSNEMTFGREEALALQRAVSHSASTL